METECSEQLLLLSHQEKNKLYINMKMRAVVYNTRKLATKKKRKKANTKQAA